MLSRSITFVIWALAAASGVFWGMQLFVRPAHAPTHVALATDSASARGDITRLLGASVIAPEPEQVSVVPDLAARMRLTGVAAPPSHSGAGVAIISVDGNPPRVYRVGAAIDSGFVLRDVSQRTATVGMVGQAGSEVRLEMPPLAGAERGVLPPPAANAPLNDIPVGLPVIAPGAPDALAGQEPPSAGQFLLRRSAR
jgi:general secretion pathway protein C